MSKINIPVIIIVKERTTWVNWLLLYVNNLFGQLSLIFITEKTEIQKSFKLKVRI